MNYKNIDQTYDSWDILEVNKDEIQNDDAILEIQNTFSEIQKCNPFEIEPKDFDLFVKLDDIANRYGSCLPSIIPHSLYGQLINFFSNTENEEIYRVILHIISSLSSDETSNALVELHRLNFLNILKQRIQTFCFFNSYGYIFHIIKNFLTDQNPIISRITHQFFPISFLLASIVNAQPSPFFMKILEKWMLCVYFTIKIYTKEITHDEANLILKQIKVYLSPQEYDFLNYPLLCQYLCIIILELIHFGKINHDDLNFYNYPAVLSVLPYLQNVKIQADSYYIIGYLVRTDHYSPAINFSNFFEVIINSNKETDTYLLLATLYLCDCYINCVNIEKSNEAFLEISKNMGCLFQLLENSTFSVKEELIKLLSSFMICSTKLAKNEITNYLQLILPISNYLFDFIESNCQFETIEAPLNALLAFVKRLTIEKIEKEYFSDFITNCYNCMTNILQLHDQKIVISANSLLKSLNEYQEA